MTGTFQPKVWYKLRVLELEQENAQLQKDLILLRAATIRGEWLRSHLRMLPPKDGEHWLWIGAQDRPRIRSGRQREYAYRAVWEYCKGPLRPTERLVRTCDDTRCVAPHHYKLRVRNTPGPAVTIPTIQSQNPDIDPAHAKEYEKTLYAESISHDGGNTCASCLRSLPINDTKHVFFGRYLCSRCFTLRQAGTRTAHFEKLGALEMQLRNAGDERPL